MNNTRWTFWLLPASMAFLTIVAVVLLVVSHESGRDRFVRSWSHGAYAAPNCPPFGVYPIPLRNCLASQPGEECRPDRVDAVQRAVTFWNTVAKEEKFRLSFFQLVDASDRRGVPLYRADLEHYRRGGHCELFRLKDDKLTEPALGWTLFPHNYAYRDARIQLCLEKFDKGLLLFKTKTRRWLKRIELWGVVAHELGHLILGPQGELDPYGLLMASKPEVREVSKTTRAIIRSKVIAKCKEEE